MGASRVTVEYRFDCFTIGCSEMQSPSGMYGGRISDITNGDVNSWSLQGSDNSTTQLELQMYEMQEENNRLKNQVKHFNAKVKLF